MSSAPSTEAAALRPWHLFALAALAASTGAIVIVRPGDPVVLVLLVAAMAAAAAVGLAVHRMLWPLAAREVPETHPVVAGRTRAALEREKTLLLRSIKELAFDHAMGKVSDADFADMDDRLRAQARRLLQQLAVDEPAYVDAIEQELARRLASEKGAPRAAAERAPGRFCAECDTVNDRDARFCKGCGIALEGAR